MAWDYRKDTSVTDATSTDSSLASIGSQGGQLNIRPDGVFIHSRIWTTGRPDDLLNVHIGDPFVFFTNQIILDRGDKWVIMPYGDTQIEVNIIGGALVRLSIERNLDFKDDLAHIAPDVFEFDRSQLVEFFQRVLPTIGRLRVQILKEGAYTPYAVYNDDRKVCLNPHMTIARQEELAKQVQNLFGEGLARTAIYDFTDF